MIFYTTKEQETVLDFDYNYKIENKKKEIKKKELETGEIEKFTAYAYVKKTPRVFYKINGTYFIEINGQKFPYDYDPISITCQIDIINPNNLGNIYKVDSTFNSKLNYFINKNKNWKIIFNLDKKNGSVCYYGFDKNNTPAEIISLDNNEKLILEDENKYDLCCG